MLFEPLRLAQSSSIDAAGQSGFFDFYLDYRVRVLTGPFLVGPLVPSSTGSQGLSLLAYVSPVFVLPSYVRIVGLVSLHDVRVIVSN